MLLGQFDALFDLLRREIRRKRDARALHEVEKEQGKEE